MQDATQITNKALERWPELLLAAVIFIVFGYIIIRLFKMYTAFRDVADGKRDDDMKRIITAHEQSSALIAGAIKSNTDIVLAAVKELRDERRRGGN